MRHLIAKLKTIPILGYFFEKNFFHYAWISGIYSVLNIFLLWLLIDKAHIPTVISSTLVIGGTFLLRYILFKMFKMM